MLENRNTNITTQLSHIYEVFSNFRLVAQIREEIEKVKPILLRLLHALLLFNDLL